MPQWSTDIVAFRIWESCLFEESVCGNFGSQLSGCPRNQTEISLAGWLILHRGAIRGDLHAASCWVSSTSLLLLVPLAPGQRIGSLLLCDRLSDRQLVAVACSFRDSLYRTWKSQTQDMCVCVIHPRWLLNQTHVNVWATLLKRVINGRNSDEVNQPISRLIITRCTDCLKCVSALQHVVSSGTCKSYRLIQLFILTCWRV